MRNTLRQLGSGLLVLSLLQLQFLMPVFATGPEGPTGPENPTGVQTVTGPEGPTGVQTQTGPEGPTGPQPEVTEITDPVVDLIPTTTAPTAPRQGEGQGAGQGSNQGTDQGTTQNLDQNRPIIEPLAGGTGDLTNDTTGADSTNTNTSTSDTDVTIDETNDATATNAIDLNANSGNNSITQNTQGGNITTGNIEAAATIFNIANSIFGDGSSVGLQSLSAEDLDMLLTVSADRFFFPTNNVTGAGSTNTNTIADSNALTFITDNTADIENDVTIVADTGNNTVSRNTAIGDFMTGSIDLAVNLINLLNVFMPNTVFSVDIWSIFGDLAGDILVPEANNAMTGSNSTNTNTVSSTNTTTVDVNQTATIDNLFDINANTGANDIARNSRTGDVATGNINVDGSVTNIANVSTPTFYLVNVLGDWAGIFSPLSGLTYFVNEMTGADSTNSNDVTQDNMTTVDVNNTATANNAISIDANTGSNTITDNTRVGNIKTGDVTIFANVVNFLNSLSSELPAFNLGIINVFGDWFGGLRTSGSAATASASSAGGGSSTASPLVSMQPTSQPSQQQTEAAITGSNPAQAQTVVAQSAPAPEASGESSVVALAGTVGAASEGASASTAQSTTTSLPETVKVAALADVDLTDTLVKSAQQAVHPIQAAASGMNTAMLVTIAFMAFWFLIEVAAKLQQRKLGQ